ncbi:MAG: DUF3479 domain-containing protein, partial [Pseudomonadota bacterium]
MTPRPITPVDAAPGRPEGPAVRVTIVTLDRHLAGAAARAEAALRAEIPGLTLTLHAASVWGEDAEALERCRADIASADVVIATMLFMEDHIEAVMPALMARRERCDAMAAVLCGGEASKATRLGRLDMAADQRGVMALLKRLRGGSKASSTAPKAAPKPGGGAGQMAMLRRLPKILRYIPGAAQDLRAFFLTMQYWLAGSEENLANLVRFLIDRYAAGPRAALRGALAPEPPREYPEVGLYHPELPGKTAERLEALAPLSAGAPAGRPR